MGWAGPGQRGNRNGGRDTAGLATTNFNGVPAGTFYRDFYLPSDVKFFQWECCNANIGYPGGANIAAQSPIDFGVYKSDGGTPALPTGSLIYSKTGITIPSTADAPFLSVPISTTNARGTDGRVCCLLANPSGSSWFGLSVNYYMGGLTYAQSTVASLPGGGWTQNTNGIMQQRIVYTTSRPRLFICGDSIGAGYSTGDVVGKNNSGWYKIAQAHDYSVDDIGIPLANIEGQWNTPASFPYYLVNANLYGAIAIVQAGINDLNSWANLAAAYASYLKMYQVLKARGIRKIILETISPSTTYAVNDGTRTAINADMFNGSPGHIGSLANAISDVDLAVRDPANHAILLAAYSNNGIHLTVAGHAAAQVANETAITAVL